jgi:hypothetical protein
MNVWVSLTGPEKVLFIKQSKLKLELRIGLTLRSGSELREESPILMQVDAMFAFMS